MNRKFKMAGVLMAVVAMFALTASAAQAQFTSEKYPATVSGKSSKDVFDAFGSTVTCTNNSFTGTLPVGGSDTLTITPSYTSCTAFGLPATVEMTSCDFLFHETARTVDVVCTKHGDAIDINVYANAAHETPICHVKVPGATAGSGGVNSGKSGYTLTQSGNNVVLGGAVGGLTATQTRTSIFCPAGTHTTTANYTIQAEGITVSGNNGKVFFD